MSSKQSFLPFLFLLGLGLFLTFAPGAWTSPVKGWWWQMIGGPSRVVSQETGRARASLDIFRQLRDLADINQRLETDNLELKARIAALHEVERENERLRAELDFVTTNRVSFEYLPADIISRSPSTYLQSVVVNRGESDGVVLGQVATANGFVVGRVESVTERTATVRLITASRSLIPVVLTTSRATGLVQGGLAGLTAEDLPNDLEVVPGESVVTSGLGSEVPPNLPVGTVISVISSETDFIQRAAIHSPIKFSKLEAIILLKPKIS